MSDLPENQYFTEQIVDAIPGIIYIYDAIAGQNIYVNFPTYNLLGYTPQQISEMGENFVTQIMHPEDLARFPAHIERLKRSSQEELCNFEYRMRHQNGEWRWFCSQDRVYSRTADGSVRQILGIAQDISERKQQETELAKTNNILQSMIRDSDDAIFVKDIHGRYIIVNQPAADWLNVTVEEMLGQDDTTLFGPEVARSIVAIDRQVLSEGKMLSFKEKVIFPSKRRWLITSKYPWLDDTGKTLGLIGISKDITVLKESEQKLEENEQLLRLALSSANAGSWNWEIETGKLVWSPENYDLYGLDPQIKHLNYQDWKNRLHPEEREKIDEEVQQVVIGQLPQFNSEFRIIHPQRGVRWIWGLGNLTCDDNNKPIKLSGINIDITERKQAEEKLRQQTEDLIRANQLKDEFLAIVSHELRTPLNPILGWSQLLTAGKLNPQQTVKGLEIIERNAKLQSQLVDDLLDVSRILRGKLNLEVTPLNLESVIRSALATVQLATEAKSIKIETAFEPNIGQVLGDAGRLQQIVWNLVSNAIKFTPEGGQITVTLKRVSNHAQIQVKDTGKGIEPEFLPFVFDRFSQAESSIARKFGGLGLGLSIVRYLTELHGGTVSVYSLGEGQGATFNVQLPLMKVPIMEQLDRKLINEPVNSNRLQGIQVLVVDDEADSLDILTLILEQEGAGVTPVASANAAIEALNQLTPDLIISDIGMPEVDGYTMLTQIRELTQAKDIPAIALTAYAGEVDRQRSLEVGFQQHISKPINITELITVVTLLTRSS